MDLKNISLIILICALGYVLFVGNNNQVTLPANHDNLYKKVMQSGKIKAAYTIYPPSAIKTANKKLEGAFVDILNKVASELGLEVEWTEEVGWATQIEGLKNGRYDIIGSSVWANPKRVKNATLSTALYYSPLYIYARVDDKRFHKITSYDLLNDPDIRISTIDGATGEVIAKNQFPDAKRVALPQSADFTQSFLEVTHNKADIIIAEPAHAMKFMEYNPNKLVNIRPQEPIRIFGNHYMLRQGEMEFVHMLNGVLTELINSGEVKKTLEKYQDYPNTFKLPAAQYELN